MARRGIFSGTQVQLPFAEMNMYIFLLLSQMEGDGSERFGGWRIGVEGGVEGGVGRCVFLGFVGVLGKESRRPLRGWVGWRVGVEVCLLGMARRGIFSGTEVKKNVHLLK